MPMQIHPALAAIADHHGLALIYLFGSQQRAALDVLRGLRPTIDDPLTDFDVGVMFRDGLPEASKRPEV